MIPPLGPSLKPVVWTIRDAIRANRWSAAKAAAPALAADPGWAPVARLLAAVADGLADPARAAAAEAAAAAIPGFDRWRFLDPALRAGRPQITSTAQALDNLLRFATTDAFLIEYPKCGRTWLRAMIGAAMRRQAGATVADPTDLVALARAVPSLPVVEVSHDDFPQLKRAAAVERDKTIYAGHRVLLLVRDPRDVVVSYYFEHTRRTHGHAVRDSFDGSIGDFVRHPVGGIDSIVAFYDAWAAARATVPGLRLVTYEALQRDTPAALAEAMSHLGYPVPPAAIAAAVAECAFDRMRAREAAGAGVAARLRAADLADPESFKVRRGKVGGFVDYLSPEDVAWIDARLAGLDDLYAEYRPAQAPR